MTGLYAPPFPAIHGRVEKSVFSRHEISGRSIIKIEIGVGNEGRPCVAPGFGRYGEESEHAA